MKQKKKPNDFLNRYMYKERERERVTYSYNAEWQQICYYQK